MRKHVKSFLPTFYAPTSNAEEAEVERFSEDPQDLLELTPKKEEFGITNTKNSDNKEY